MRVWIYGVILVLANPRHCILFWVLRIEYQVQFDWPSIISQLRLVGSRHMKLYIMYISNIKYNLKTRPMPPRLFFLCLACTPLSGILLLGQKQRKCGTWLWKRIRGKVMWLFTKPISRHLYIYIYVCVIDQFRLYKVQRLLIIISFISKCRTSIYN